MKRLENRVAIATGAGASRMNRGIRASLVAATLLALTACAVPVSGVALEEKLRQAGASVRGLGSNPEVFPITADSPMAAWTMLGESKESAPLPLARQLDHRMGRASKRNTMLVVGGPYSSLTREVLLDALALNEGKPLPGLVLVYVGSAESAREIRTAAGALGIRFVQRELP
jgi:hypothetical protein